jgi:rod shape-determining protein MreC
VLQPSRGGRSRYVLALLAATAITLVTLDFRGFGPLQRAEATMREVLGPLADGVGTVTRPVRDVWHGIADYDAVKGENDRLRNVVAQLRASRVDGENARDQLDTILAQQHIDTPGATPKRLARVVAGPASSFENTIRIDQGSDAGIAPGMTVRTDAGLVGRVRDVTSNRAVVELADSHGFAVGVRLVGGNAQATFIARGQAPGSPLELEGDVDPSLGIRDGVALVTSGLDQSLYPPDVLVGRVTGTGWGAAAGERPPVTVPGGQPAPLKNVKVDLFVDLRALSYVTVLLWQPPG